MGFAHGQMHSEPVARQEFLEAVLYEQVEGPGELLAELVVCMSYMTADMEVLKNGAGVGAEEPHNLDARAEEPAVLCHNLGEEQTVESKMEVGGYIRMSTGGW